MSEVKRFDEYTCGVTEAEDGEYVKHSDYAKLEAEAQALREEIAKLRITRDDFKLERDLARKNFCDEQAANYQLKAHLKACLDELSALRARVVVLPEPVTMDGTTTIREYVANAVPKDTPMDKWTQGYEECKRRIHAMFEQPCNKRLNGLTVSEGLLRDLLKSAQKLSDRAAGFSISGVEFMEIGDNNSAIVELEVTLDELRALLNQDKENGNG
ncbi:hypothetical protein ACM751_16230 [Pseudomonas aeruginosa]